MSPDGSKSIPPPEEKLLRLIRGKGPTPTAPSAEARSADGPTAVGTSSAAGTVLPRSPATSTPRWVLPSWWLMAVNVTLGCVAVVELITIAIVMFQPAPQPRDVATNPSLSADLESDAHALDLPPLSPESIGGGLRATVAGRPLFQPVMATSSGLPSRQPGAMSGEAKALAGRLNVIGLVDGDPPQAIIEDTQTQKTYFVAAGQQVTEGLVVTEIRGNRVVLDLNGQTIELSF